MGFNAAVVLVFVKEFEKEFGACHNIFEVCQLAGKGLASPQKPGTLVAAEMLRPILKPKALEGHIFSGQLSVNRLPVGTLRCGWNGRRVKHQGIQVGFNHALRQWPTDVCLLKSPDVFLGR